MRAFAPRIGSNESAVVGPRNGWVAVYDEVDRRGPDRARPVRTRALLAHGRRRHRALARGRRGGAHGGARPRRDRGRVPLGPRVLRPARARRRDRDGGEPHRPRPADGRRPAARPRGARRRRTSPADLPPARETAREPRDRARARRAPLTATRGSQRWPRVVVADALRRAAVPVLRPDADRARREGRAVRDGDDRPREPARLAHRAQPARRPRPGARGRRLGAARVGRSSTSTSTSDTPSLRCCPSTRASGRSRASSSSASTTSATRTTHSAAARQERPSGWPTRSPISTHTLAAMPFLTGRSFGLADVAYLPWLLRLRDLMGVSLDAYPALTGWLGRCCRAAVGRGRGRDGRVARRMTRRHRRRARGQARRAGSRPARRPASPRSSPGRLTAPCDPRPGRIPGARNVDVTLLLGAGDDAAVRELVGVPAGAEVIAYCHSGSRSGARRRRCSPRPGTRRGTTSARGTSGRATRRSPPRPSPTG